MVVPSPPRPAKTVALSFPFFSLKDKNQGELIPPVLRFTVTYLREKGE